MTNPKLIYCVHCDAKVPYTTDFDIKRKEKRGIDYEFDVVVCNCAICGNPVRIPQIHDSNCRNDYLAYNRARIEKLRSQESL